MKAASTRTGPGAEKTERLRLLFRDIVFRTRGLSRRRLGHFGLTPTEFLVLAALMRRDGAGAGEVAEEIFVSPSTMSRTLAGLEKAGYLRRVVDSDRRRVRLILRPRGRRLRERVRAFWIEMGRSMFEGLSDEERSVLERSLEHIHANVVAVETREGRA